MEILAASFENAGFYLHPLLTDTAQDLNTVPII
jgi:hypothetical protein